MKVKVLQDAFYEIYNTGVVFEPVVLSSIKNIKDMLSLETDQYHDLSIPFPKQLEHYRFKLFHLNPNDDTAYGVLFVSNSNNKCFRINYTSGMCFLVPAHYSDFGRFIKQWRETHKETKYAS